MSESNPVPHFVLIPLLAQGHMIPMIDMAKLLVQNGVVTSIVTTPNNTTRFQKTIQRARINLIEIPFPWKEVGLPPNCENLDSVPSRDLIRKFYTALDMLQEPLEEYLANHGPPPSCIISDKCLSWTSKTARKFGVPRVVFHGMCCFSLLSSHNVKLQWRELSGKPDSDLFRIPGLPFNVDIRKSQLPGSFVALPDLDDIRGQMQEAELNAFGVVVNTFPEIEGGCVEEYRKAINKKVWCIGPVSLCNKEIADKYERGNIASIDARECLKWLDSMKPGLVIYACLGSQCRLIPDQLIQLGLGLEISMKPFIWVIKNPGSGEDGHRRMEKWLSGFEERVRGRGLVIKGWAPQVMILSHPSVGGFLTHCGWNSTIEGVCSGVPMLTWPMFAEQFLNEKLVAKEQVGSAVEELMGCGEDGERRRIRARELKLVATSTMEDGGSTHVNISAMIRDVMEHTLMGGEEV